MGDSGGQHNVFNGYGHCGETNPAAQPEQFQPRQGRARTDILDNPSKNPAIENCIRQIGIAPVDNAELGARVCLFLCHCRHDRYSISRNRFPIPSISMYAAIHIRSRISDALRKRRRGKRMRAAKRSPRPRSESRPGDFLCVLSVMPPLPFCLLSRPDPFASQPILLPSALGEAASSPRQGHRKGDTGGFSARSRSRAVPPCPGNAGSSPR